MQLRKLKNTSLHISPICFGCFTAGGHGWGDVADNDSIKSIQLAFENNINFFDTADVYGLGHSESILKKALGLNIKKTIISTKVGVRYNQKTKLSFADCSPEWIRKSVDGSLERLGVEAIDIYTLHRYDSKIPLEETLKCLNELKEAGKVKYFAFSNFPLEVLENNDFPKNFTSCQYEYSLGSREPEEKLIPLVNKLNINFMSYSPLMQGILTGKFNQQSEFPANDARSKHPNFQGENFLNALAVVENLKKVSSDTNYTIAQLSLAWLMKNKEVSSIICGVRNEKQLQEILGASEVEFDVSLLGNLGNSV